MGGQRVNPDLKFGALQKPARGANWRDNKKRSADRAAYERKEMDAAKKRDGNKCRVPRCEWMPKKPRIEAAHMEGSHRGMGGNKDGSRTERKKVIALCLIHHGQYDRTGELVIEPQTKWLFDGPCAYYKKNKETGRMEHWATERTIGVSVAVGR